MPAGPAGPAFLVTRNFDVVYSYNAAESYSLAACVLADRLAGGAGIVTPWPTDDPGLSRVERRELQTLLTRKGYDVGEPDGAIGDKTKAGDRRLPAEAGHAGERAGVGEGAGGAEAVEFARVIASEAKNPRPQGRSNPGPAPLRHGLLRRYAPRNDGCSMLRRPTLGPAR